MHRKIYSLGAAFFLALIFPASSMARNTVNTYWYQPHYMAKVDDAYNSLQFMSPHFVPGNPYALPTPATTTFTLEKVSTSSLGLNLFFNESGSTEKSPGLLSLTTVTVPYKKEDLVSVVYADIAYFEIRNTVNDPGPSPWCVIPQGRPSTNNVFCVPTKDDAQRVIDALATLAVAYGTTLRTSSSMAVMPMSDKAVRKHPDWTGCDVLEVDLEGPGAQAGIQMEDIVHTVNGAVCTPQVIFAAVAEATAKEDGGDIQVGLLRKGQPLTATLHFPHAEVDAAALRQQITDLSHANASPQPSGTASAAAPVFHLGINVHALTDSELAATGLPKPQGVLVTLIEKGSIAEQMGLQVGDVIVLMNGVAVDDAGAFAQSVRSGAARNFRVWRQGKALDLTVPQSM